MDFHAHYELTRSHDANWRAEDSRRASVADHTIKNWSNRMAR
jgi:hypothetical protein